MSTPIFSKTHNLIAYTEKPTKSKGFAQIIDFLNGSSVKYALTASLIIYTSCIKQFLISAKVKTVNDEVRIQALVDGKRVNIKESSIKCTLRLDDAKGTSCLTNIKIFKGLAKMRFVQLIINHQLGDMAYHKEIFDTPSFTKKVFANMKRVAKQNLPSPFNDPLPSGEDSLKLKELIDLCTNLSNKVLKLESEVIDIKSTYQERIKKLKGRVERELHAPKRNLRLIDEHFESESVDVSTVSSSDGKTIKTVDVKGMVSKEEPKPVKKNSFSLPIIEDWVSKSEEEDEPKFQKQVNTAKGKVVVNDVKGNGFNAVKASAFSNGLGLEKSLTLQLKIGTSSRRSLGEEDASKQGRILK
uniref:Uncharacterized protein n=1 Tax=Tanacetum cinerariifolium TaxID=118510 RepID=A0A699HPK4_TANCI|nr:hypothetical protein [Tanacetum cinerariifolium]